MKALTWIYDTTIIIALLCVIGVFASMGMVMLVVVLTMGLILALITEPWFWVVCLVVIVGVI